MVLSQVRLEIDSSNAEKKVPQSSGSQGLRHEKGGSSLHHTNLKISLDPCGCCVPQGFANRVRGLTVESLIIVINHQLVK